MCALNEQDDGSSHPDRYEHHILAIIKVLECGLDS